MKKKLFVAFALCSMLSLLLPTMTVFASNPAYPTRIFSGRTGAAMDGYWTNSTEWDDAAAPPAGLPAAMTFRDKYTVTFSGGLKVYEWYLIEFFTDNTNNAGDYVQICFNGNASGGAAPNNATDLRIDIIGHNGTVVTYKGNGTAWVPAVINDTIVAQTLNTSKLNGNQHWITEFRIEKQVNGLQYNNSIRVACYDAANATQGVVAFPPGSSQDVPSGWSLNFPASGNLPAAGPAMIINQGRRASTIDGYWTAATEWDDAASPAGLPANWVFRNKWIVQVNGTQFKVFEQYLVEFFSDNTSDAGDYVQLCFDVNGTGTLFPAKGDIRLDYVGHNGTLITYVGDGLGWVPTPLNSTTAAQTFSNSKLNATNHWVTEFSIEKTTNGLGMNNSLRVAVYDANRSSAGVSAYPSTSQVDVPVSFSYDGFTTAFVPEPPAVPPLFATAFQNVTVFPGWNWYFFVQYQGGGAPYTFQWYENTTALAGQTNAWLPVTKNARGVYNFYCRVSDSTGLVANSTTVSMTVVS